MAPPNYSLSFDQVAAMRGDLILFEGLSFTLHPGHLIWLQGANGSGKTTILTLATGFRKPAAGKITWQIGDDVCQPEDLIAYQGHLDAQKPDLSVSEDLDFWADIYGSELNLDDLLQTIELSDRRSLACGQLSAGQKRRLSIGRLILSGKPIWIMDEPTASIDQSGQKLILGLIKDHLSSGGAVLLATHRALPDLGVPAQSLTLEAA